MNKMSDNNESVEQVDENEIIALRREKLTTLREGIAFPNDFKPDTFAADIREQYDNVDNEILQTQKNTVKIAGRVMARRIMGKASFIHLQDMTGKMQCYVRRDDLPEGVYADFKKWDIGDIIGLEGFVFMTKTEELSVHATSIRLLTKSIRPIPDKFHGLCDQELCYRRRYLDLIANPETRTLFQTRTKIINEIRGFLENRRFMEVETPMMHYIPGGAAARPFKTHHNALDMPLYLRIAPELYLKRLVVGGIDRVFEINRNFRNEGVSTRHNPEFTMLEFYQAYADYKDLMDLTEEMLRNIAVSVTGDANVKYQEHEIDFSKPFLRITLCDAILKYNADCTSEILNDINKARAFAESKKSQVKEGDALGKIQLEIFEKTVEDQLLQPTFVTEYPAEVSPLSRKNDDNDFYVDRFELFIGGREIANGFSELNDPEDQAERFQAQVARKEAGDAEAMGYDEEYITALEYGLPPTAGEGIGIDRLVMIFTDSPSIRDVLLFPYMRAK
jgi:lysyl-tRNA synthetase class 2